VSDPAPKRDPAVGVVIPAHNEERWIGECLDSLRAQTLQGFDLVVVDDSSSDRTGEIARARGARVLRVENAGDGGARDAGAEVAEGDVLVFLDADEIFDPDFLERLVAPFSDPKVRATFPGGVRYRNAGEGLAPGWLRIRGIRDRRPPRFSTPHWFAKAVRRQDFERVGGYPREGYGSDETFGRLVGPVVVVDDAGWEFTLPTGVREVFGKARWIGRGPQFARQRPRLWRFSPLGSVPAAVRHLAGGEPRTAAVRLIYDAGLLVGFAESHLRPSVRHHA
jgi:glycosyltransferase involved in cell wall biosynthesis